MNSAQENVENDGLRWALSFVEHRIHKQAQVLSETLSADDEEKLANLPDTYVSPEFSLEAGSTTLISPDRTYDRLVRLAKLAIEIDRRDGPDLILRWELADVILRLNEHRMAWLIERAGIEFKKPWWDGWLLVVSGIFVLLISCSAAILAYLFGIRDERLLGGFLCATFALICVVLFFLLDRFERWLWRNRVRELNASLGNAFRDTLY